MTTLYLLCYISYTTFTSIIFSLLLALRLLLHRVSGYGRSAELGNIVALYEGTVCHQRRHPARNSFRFPARYALIDLDRPPYAPPNYLSADDARRAAKTNGPVHLLRIPPSLGYERSPVNLYYCYDIQGSTRTLKKCLVEASNTPWGESVTFVFNPGSDTVPKSEYISPFMDMLGNWRLKMNEPGESLCLIISVQHPKLGNHFTATYTATRVNISSNMYSDDFEAFFWLMPHKVSITAYWNALKLWWKNVPFYTHPRTEKPTYREEAFARDEKIQFCPLFGGNKANNNMKRVEERVDRCFVWKDAKWPWSYLIW
ncbi:hypothetical protein PHJA_000668200 [Phtheirospermum japonicum]|uniref:Uncharacterized protein n=1 Tax=Phtheirospermum japonicum TaxID=374723 RepID=A0A830BMZ8_9LAMI|nr:hypothetical protein PHJA_000668200 [Phtheirospermum japonicum]